MLIGSHNIERYGRFIREIGIEGGQGKLRGRKG